MGMNQQTAVTQSQYEQTGISAFFSVDNLNKLHSLMYDKTVKAGSCLFWEDDPAEYLYYVKKGRVKLTKSTDTGNKITLYLYNEGDMFGQIVPFQNATQSFDAEIIEDAEFGIIQQKDLETMLWQHGDLGD